MKLSKTGLAVFLLSAVLILFASYPAAVNIFQGKIVLGENNFDLAGNIWLMNRYQEFRGSSPYEDSFFYTRMICYPFGFDVRNMLNIFPALLFSYIVNFRHFILTVNLLIILIFGFNYFSMYFLARYVLRKQSLAALSGFAFSTSYHIYVLLGSGKLEKLLIGFVPLALLFIIKLINGEASARHRIFAGIFTGLAFLSDYHSIYFMFIFAVAYLLFVSLTSGKRPGIKSLAASTAVISLIVLFMSLPLITLFYEAYTADIVAQKGKYLATKDTLEHKLSDIVLKYEIRLPFTMFAILLASVFFLKRMDKSSYFWLISIIIFWLLALGNYIVLPGLFQHAGIKKLFMPLYFMRKYLPGMARLSGSERIVYYVYVAAAIYIVKVIDHMLIYIKPAKGKIAVMAAFCLLVSFELVCFNRDFPIKSYKFDIPEYYRTDLTGAGAFLHLPVFAADKTQMIFQPWHKKPICGYELGLENEYVINPGLLKLFRSNLFIQDLMYLNYTFLFFLNRDYFKTLYPYTQPEKVSGIILRNIMSRHIEYLKKHCGEPVYQNDLMMVFGI